MSDRGGDEQAKSTAASVARRSYGKLVALLAARAGDVQLAEEALSDAFVAALATWPRNGCPVNPEAWLLTAARRKMIDGARQRRHGELAVPTVQLLHEELRGFRDDAHIPDQRLALMFACAHPAIEAGIRAPLMLQVVLGLDAATIASAFLVSPTAMGQRLARAKTKIRTAGIPFAIPAAEDLPARTAVVLDAVYATFAEGWNGAGDPDVSRRDLTDEALFLGRLAIELLPDDAEALGLLALMLHAEARRAARRDHAGEYVPLADQDPTSWNGPMIDEAEELLRRASALGSIGRYQIEAALQSAHLAGRRTGRPDWPSIVVLYDALVELTGSPVVAINRAVALAEVHGAEVGLRSIDALSTDVRLTAYQPYWVVRANLLARLGAVMEARAAYEIAIGLARDPAVRRFLQRCQSALVG